MNIRRAHRQVHNNVTRASRSQAKLQRLRDSVRASTQLFMARHQARMEWWQRAFRTPMVANWWIVTQARTLYAAIMSFLGLNTSHRRSSNFTRQTSNFNRRSMLRGLIHEPLEARQLSAINVAVVGDIIDGNTAGYVATVNQLNNDSYFDFSASLVN